MLRIKLLDSKSDQQEFHQKLCFSLKEEILSEYLEKSSCYNVYWMGSLVGGFAITNLPPLNLRAVYRMKGIYLSWHLYGSRLEDTSEFTGFFIEDSILAPALGLALLWTILLHRSPKFVYSYRMSQKAIGDCCKLGDPEILFLGKLTDDTEKSSVEILTRFGIIKVIVKLTNKYFSWRKIYERIHMGGKRLLARIFETGDVTEAKAEGAAVCGEHGGKGADKTTGV